MIPCVENIWQKSYSNLKFILAVDSPTNLGVVSSNANLRTCFGSYIIQ